MRSRFEFEPQVLLPYIGYYFQGLQVTVALALAALTIALLVGLALALMSVSRFALLRAFVAGYVWIFRAIPIYVYLLWVYYGLPVMAGVNLSPVTAGLICLGSQLAAFQAEVFRASLKGVSVGQVEAAMSVGLSRLQTFTSVTLPQMVRVALPPTGSNFVLIVRE